MCLEQGRICRDRAVVPEVPSLAALEVVQVSPFVVRVTLKDEASANGVVAECHLSVVWKLGRLGRWLRHLIDTITPSRYSRVQAAQRQGSDHVAGKVHCVAAFGRFSASAGRWSGWRVARPGAGTAWVVCQHPG